MNKIVLKVRHSVKERLGKMLGKCRNAGTRLRYLMIINVINGRSARETEKVLHVHHTTVGRVVERFRRYGEAGLQDGRGDNGADKLGEGYLQRLHTIVSKSPDVYGWRRPTWTRELLIETMVRLTGVRIHVTTMSRALALIKARRGRPKPIVGCPWPKAAKTRRLRQLQRLTATLPRRERVFYEDEVDIHLNPKIGPDWMLQGQQKTVPTPGQNQKRYLAGALDARTGKLTWIEGERKNSTLFLLLIHRLVTVSYRSARRIHIILDNYKIHDSRQVHLALASWKGKVQLHFLPPYCPDHNRIERLWKDLHDNVTRNHCCKTMEELMADVHSYLRCRRRRGKHCYPKRKSA